MKDTSAKAFVDHWVPSARKGLLAISTSRSISAACRAVLKVQEGWERLTVTKLDVDDALRKFREARKDLKPASIQEYATRFRRAVESYREFLEDPAAWNYPERGTRKSRALAAPQKRAPAASGKRAPAASGKRAPAKPPRAKKSGRAGPGRPRGTAARSTGGAARKLSAGDFQEYKYPFRQNAMAGLTIPRDATTAEINRLAAWARTLAIDYEPES